MKPLVSTARLICATLIALEATVVAAGAVDVDENNLYWQSALVASIAAATVDTAGSQEEPRRIALEIFESCFASIDDNGCFVEFTLELQHSCLGQGGCLRDAFSPDLKETIDNLCCGKAELSSNPALLINLFPNPITGISSSFFFGIPTFWDATWPYSSGGRDRSYHVIEFDTVDEEESYQGAWDTLTLSGGVSDGQGTNSFRKGGFKIDVTSKNNGSPQFVYVSAVIGGMGVCSHDPGNMDCMDPNNGIMGAGDSLYFRPYTGIWINELVFKAKYPIASLSLDIDSRISMNTADSPFYTLRSEMTENVNYYYWKPTTPYFVAAHTAFEIGYFRESFSLTSMHLHTQSSRYSLASSCVVRCSSIPEPASLGILILGLCCISFIRIRVSPRAGHINFV